MIFDLIYVFIIFLAIFVSVRVLTLRGGLLKRGYYKEFISLAFYCALFMVVLNLIFLLMLCIKYQEPLGKVEAFSVALPLFTVILVLVVLFLFLLGLEQGNDLLVSQKKILYDAQLIMVTVLSLGISSNNHDYKHICELMLISIIFPLIAWLLSIDACISYNHINDKRVSESNQYSFRSQMRAVRKRQKREKRKSSRKVPIMELKKLLKEQRQENIRDMKAIIFKKVSK